MPPARKLFFISTPIYYPSGSLHIGHAYTTTVGDVLTRYKRMRGYDAFFLTGSDEHGQKIARKAKEAGMEPQPYVDAIVKTFVNLWQNLGIGYDKFIRTTDPRHVSSVQQVFEKMRANGDIYLGEWNGLYCVSCEENYTESRAVLKDGKRFCVHGHELEERKEPSYFFKMSKYGEWVGDLLKNTPDFTLPRERVNELINNFVAGGLEDLSVTRTTFKWGVPVLNDPRHVVYVWIDALFNYVTALGYTQKDDKLLKHYWSKDAEIIHLVGKEITRFHSIYWPIMLKSVGLRLPTTVYAHGWITTKEGKMSKSLGNVVEPNDLIRRFGRDALRYYLVKNVPLGSDGVYSDDLMVETHNANLSNNFGNLVFRTRGMLAKYLDGAIPSFKGPANDLQKRIADLVAEVYAEYAVDMDEFRVAAAINAVNRITDAANKYIEDLKPWQLFADKKVDELTNSLGLIVQIIRVANRLLSPVLIDAYPAVNATFGFTDDENDFDSLLKPIAKGRKIGPATPLFERIELPAQK